MLVNNLSKIMGAKRIRISELSKISGISKQAIIRLYYDRSKNISLHTLERLCYALEVTPSEIFEYSEN